MTAALLLGGCGLAHSAPPTQAPLTVGYYEFPPAIYSDPQQRARGPVAELTRRVLRRAGYRARFRSLPSARLYAGLKSGSVDLWAGAPGKPELAVHTLESRHTLGRIHLNLYYRPDTPPPRIPEDLAGQGVILISGYSYWPEIIDMLQDPALGVRVVHTSNHESALQMLRYRRANYVLDYQAPVSQARQRLRLGELPFLPISEVPIHFIVSRYAADSEAVLAALDRAYDELRAAGEDVRLPDD